MRLFRLLNVAYDLIRLDRLTIEEEDLLSGVVAAYCIATSVIADAHVNVLMSIFALQSSSAMLRLSWWSC